MADNAAQAIKDLQKNIESLDVSLDKALKSQEKYTQMIAKTFQDAANQGKTSIDELVAYIGKKTKQVSAEKIKLQIDLGLGKKGELEQQIASMKSDIAKYEKSKDTHAAELLKQQLKDLEDEYKRLASASKKSAAQMYDDMLKIVNAAAGTKKDGKGTALGQARAAAAKENLNTIKEIDRLTTQIAEKQEKLGKYKEGSKNWEKTKKDIEEAGKKLQQYQDKLNRLQGRKVEDASAKAIKAQVANMRELYNLNKQYRQMMSQRRQGMLVNPQDLADTRQRLREILATMKRIESEHPGSRKTAAARLETERLRDRWKEANRETKANRLELDKMLPTLQRLASAFGVAFSVRGLAQFGKKLIETRGEFELQQVALRSILQNKQLADEIWDKTLRASLQSPYTAMQLTKYTKQLAAYRIETAKLFDTTKRLADVSAGLGVDMQRLILAYGQVKAANYLRASEIRQFTEAGVNILGELSQYFTGAKGEMVSTAQVMDMVQKRMVKFEDVAEIFKRMTDQGGIFYNMQYIQSQTVRGQMMKLKDAFDQMLNSIGQGNEGVIKNLISLLNDIVKNWREWKTAIDLIAWPVIISMLYKFALGLIAVDAAAIKASVGMNTMVVAGARLQLLFKRLWAAIAAHPLLALASALAAVGVALWNHAKAVNGINKAYEDLMLRTYETQKNLGEYSKTIQRNSEIMAHATKDTDEYNKAYSENEKIISKLSNDYPDLLKDIDLQKEGYGVLVDKIEAYNKKLEDRIRLEYAARASFGTDDLATNIADMQEALRKREMEFLENREKAEKRYLDLKGQGKESEEDYWNKMMRHAKNWAEQVDVLEQNKTAMRDGGISLLSQGFVMPGIGGFWGGGVQSRAADLSANIKKESLIFNDIIKEQLKSINENLGDDIETFIKANQDEVDRMFKDKEGAGWKLLNERITEFFTAKGVAGRESQQVIQDLLNQFLLIPIQLDWSGNEAGSTYQPDFELNAAILRKQVNLLEEMKKRYDELSKSAYGYAKSEEKVRQAFKDSFEEIFKDSGIDMKDIDFSSMEGLSASIQKVLDAATNIKEEVKQEIMKKIDSYEARIEIDAQVRVREDFARQMEEAFGDYELTLDLQKLNLPTDLLTDMFGIEAVDLSALRQKIADMYKNLRGEDDKQLDETDRKNIENYLKKIDDMERKAQRKRIEDYAKYLEYEMSEKAKITMTYAKKIAEVQAETAFTSAQKDRIIKGLTKEMGEKAAKQNWEDFKGSEMYVQMMQDLEKNGTAAIITMRKELEKLLRDSAKDLDPRSLKEITDVLAKMKELELNRQDPFSGVAQARKEMQEAMNEIGAKSVEQVYAEANANQSLLITEKQRKDELEEIVNYQKQEKQIKEELEKLPKYRGFSVEDLENRQDTLKLAAQIQEQAINNLRQERITATTERSREIDEEIDGINQKINAYKKEADQLEKIIQYRVALGEIPQAVLTVTDAEQKYTEQTTKVEGLETEQSKYQAAIEAIDRHNKQVQRAIQLTQEWSGKMSNLWSAMKDLFSSDTEMFGDWSERYGEVIDVMFTQFQNLTSALSDFMDGLSNIRKNASGTVQAMQANIQAQTQLNIQKALSGELSTADAVANTQNAVATQMATVATEAFSAALAKLLLVLSAVTAAVTIIITLWAAFNRAHDKNIAKRIENLQKKIDALKDAYARLEKQIEQTLTTEDYIRTEEEQISNLRKQIVYLEQQISAEKSKKNSSYAAIRQYEQAIIDAENQIEELHQKQLETFGGIGKSGYRAAAQEFVEAWKEAFLDTGDGLEGLQEHFDEFLNEWFVKQATMRYAAAALEPVFRMIDDAVDPNGVGGANVVMQELEAIKEWARVNLPQISETLEDISRPFIGDGEGGLSGLAAGIQGMSEEQANVLESYWNSVRMYTASIDMNVSRIAEIIGAGVGDRVNPQLQQLELIARNTSAIQSLFGSVVEGGHTRGGRGVRVFVD